MRLTNEFDTPLSVGQVWELLEDPAVRSEAMPGVNLRPDDGGVHRGTIELTVGRDTVRYDATVTVVDRDRDEGVCVLGVEGAGTSGHGDLEATIIVRLTGSGAGSVVYLDAEVKVTGRLARHGRGALGDVSNELARHLRAAVAPEPVAADVVRPVSATRDGESATVRAGGAGVANTALAKVAPSIAAVALLVLLWRWLGRRAS